MFMIANSLVDLNLNQTLRTPELLSDAVRLGRGLRKNLRKVLLRLRENKVTANPRKTRLDRRKI